MKTTLIPGLLSIFILLNTVPVSGHGLSNNSDANVLVTGKDPYLMKVVIWPKNIEFVRPNYVTVSIIDTEKARHFEGQIRLSLWSGENNLRSTYLSRETFTDGLFKTRANFQKQGSYRLVVDMKNEETDLSLPVFFDIRDERTIPTVVGILSLISFVLLLGAVYAVRRKGRTIFSGRE